MDSPANLMMIVGVDVFDGPCDVARLRRLIEEHLLQFMQFRARVVQDATGAWWQEDPDFDLDHHLVQIRLPGKGGKHELQKEVARLAAEPLDPTRPLWQFHLVENYDGGHALIVRIHHCIADGIALIGVLLSLTTAEADVDPPAAEAARRKHDGTGTAWEQWLRPFTEATVKAIDAGGDAVAKALHAYAEALSARENPAAKATEYAQEIAHTAAQVAKDAAALALMTSDTATCLKGQPTGIKVVAWNEPLPLADVKAVGKAIGCSVNDVLLSCVAGALRGYLLDRGEHLDGAELRAMVPVNLRAPGKPQTLGNKFGLVPLLLPIGIDSPIDRVLEVRKRMDELKDGYTAVLAMAILGAAGLVPRFVQDQLMALFQRKATAVMTNVPGPQQALYMAGAKIRQMMFWVPQSGVIGVGVSILSYDGGVQFGLITDKKLCPDPQHVIDRFVPEFEKLVHAVLLMPWEPQADKRMAERSLQATEALAAAAVHSAHAASAKAARGNGGTAHHAAPKPVRKRKSAFAAARVRH
jgi:WS/DGAT/MGAT family acyltransferase